MSVSYGDHLTGRSNLSRMHCAPCGCETLHKGDMCVHCKSVREPDLGRQVQLDSLNVYRLGVTRSPAQLANCNKKKLGRPRKVHS
jgi:hypothetical protein